jgi:hypothetical protein
MLHSTDTKILLGCLAFCLAIGAASCEDISGLNGNPDMNPGQDCMSCHTAGGQASGRQWTIAGTVFPSATSPADGGLQNAEILIVDSASPPKAITLISDQAGNFYTAETFTGGVHVAVQTGNQRYEMQEIPPTGSCNLCHATELNAQGQVVPIPLPAPYVDAGFFYGSSPPGRVFVPLGPPDGGVL